MKSRLRKQRQYVILLLVLISMFLTGGIGYTQEARVQHGREKIRYYEMDGRLQAFNLDEKWALIGGLKWSLADMFDVEEFRAIVGVKKRGTVEFSPQQKTWATYYVILQPLDVSSVDIIKKKEMDEKEIKLILDPYKIKSIYEQGGKIFKIVPIGM